MQHNETATEVHSSTHHLPISTPAKVKVKSEASQSDPSPAKMRETIERQDQDSNYGPVELGRKTPSMAKSKSRTVVILTEG